ncbi:L-threonylcarbamoyladenylate synthase [Agaribacterium sp. ZY112]|uniref:L-threonylcarbamoyladenylate synthase n=1 Tax=Agaribacterium sp. ZY112 TaxID=3233574 RepID=UPI00352527C5
MNYLANPRIRHCARVIRAGGVVSYPTEGVWGLGCDPENQHAVETILKLKSRPVHKGLILISGRAEDFSFLLKDADVSIQKRVISPTDVATTWLVEHKGRVPNFISGDSNLVAIRISSHPVVSALSALAGGAIVSTSANPAGLPSALNSTKVRHYFRNQAICISPGAIAANRGASRIINAASGERLR